MLEIFLVGSVMLTLTLVYVLGAISYPYDVDKMPDTWDPGASRGTVRQSKRINAYVAKNTTVTVKRRDV